MAGRIADIPAILAGPALDVLIANMWVYALALAYFYAAYHLSWRHGRAGWGVTLGALPAVALVLLRGQVGVDTPNYVSAVEVLRDVGDRVEMFEPLFEQILLTLSRLPLPPMGVLALVSAITTLLLLRGWWQVERDMVLFTGIFAVYFFDMTMNGLRYGLAFAVITVAAAALVRGRFVVFVVLVAAASLIQITSVLMGAVLLLCHEFRWRSVLVTGLLAALVSLSFGDYLLLKVLANEILQKPGALSGLSTLALVGSLLAVWGTRPDLRAGAQGKIALLASLALAAYAVAQVSYAGLRLLSLLAFLTALVLACHMHKRKLRFDRRTALVVIAIGILFGTLKLRNMAQSDEEAEAPFVPYRFTWEER